LLLLADRRNIELVIKDGQIVARSPSTKLNGIPESVIAGAWICCGLPSPGPSILHWRQKTIGYKHLLTLIPYKLRSSIS